MDKLRYADSVLGGKRTKFDPFSVRDTQRQRGARAPIEKFAPWATAWEGLLPVLHMHSLLERSCSTRTAMKRTFFPAV